MNIYPNTSKVLLQGYEDYRCYLYNSTRDFNMQLLRSGETFKLNLWNGYYSYDDKPWKLVPNGMITYRGSADLRSRVRGILNEGDRIMLHPKCDIPALSVSDKYKVISSRSDTVANKIAIPNHVKPHIWTTVGGHIIPFINKYDNVVLLVSVGYSTCDLKSPELAKILLERGMQGTGIDVTYFKPMDNEDEFYTYRLTDMDDLSYAIISGVIPRDRLVFDSDIPVKGEPVTKELILNTYRLLNSSDEQLRLTGLLTLAQHNCKGYEEIIGWLFAMYKRTMYGYKQKNAALRWLIICCDEYYSPHGQFYQPRSNSAGKWLIEQLTEGAIRYNEGNELVITDSRINHGWFKRLTEQLR